MEMKAHAYSPSSCGKSDEKPSLIHTRPSRRDGYRLEGMAWTAFQTFCRVKRERGERVRPPLALARLLPWAPRLTWRLRPGGAPSGAIQQLTSRSGCHDGSQNPHWFSL